MEDNLYQCAGLASYFIGEHFDNCKPLIDKDFSGMHPLVRFVSSQLFIACHLSSESSLILIREEKEWDAEIINRSIAEGVIKYIFIVYCSPEEQLKRAKEYWEILPNYSAIRRSDRAHGFLTAIDGYGIPKWKAIEDLALDDKTIEELRGGKNRKERKGLERKWSFNEILNNFAKSENKKLELLIHLLHNYGLNSHLIHKDGDGIGMIWDRFQREPGRQHAAKLGHKARIISDICIFSELRSYFLFQSCNQPSDFIDEIKERYANLTNELQEATEYFNNIEYQT